MLYSEVYKINDKKKYPLTIFVQDSMSVYLNANDEFFLSKILKSINFDLKKVELINTVNLKQVNKDAYLTLINSSNVISFGVNLGVTFQNYSLEVREHCKILLVDSLREISKSQSKKKMLWGELKKMFLPTN